MKSKTEAARRIEAALKRYHMAGHAVQSGVKAAMESGWDGCAPKHLRTGLDLRASDHAGLVALLIRKGIIDEAEYTEAMADQAEKEKELMEHFVSQLLGRNVTLG
jgi:hypothetical protein